MILKNVLISEICDDDIKKVALGLADVNSKDVKETVLFIKVKEMDRDSLSKQFTNAANSSSYKKGKRV